MELTRVEMLSQPVLLFLLVQVFPWTEGTGKIVTKFLRFENVEGKKLDGYCCDKYWWGAGDCQTGDMCDPAFVICLGNITESSSIESCEYGRRTTGVLSDDTNIIAFNEKMGDQTNPLVFNFNEWPGVVMLKILATDADASDRYDIMDSFTYMHNQNEVVKEIDATSKTLQLSGSRSKLNLEMTVFCDLNFYGKNCDTFCAPPDDGTAHFMCDPLTGERICLAGYEGANCRTNKDDCEGNPCHKGSTCQDGLDSYTCLCQLGRTGVHCKEEIDECLSDPCQHGGTCRDQEGFYYCECPVGTLGDNCEIDIIECESNPCQNNGSCVDQVNAFECICQKGYEGTTCDKEIDECAAEPCVQATGCTDLIGDYTCECVEGFTGKNCDVDINECESQPCQNSGLCVDIVNSYSCICRDGTSGKFCEINFDECESGPCQNGGSCVDHINAYSCVCPSPYTGNMCETKLTPCQRLPCQNGATCTDDGDTFKCKCHQGFTGTVCDVNINECESSPCQNGGFCMDLTGQYRCRCPPYYTGYNCETLMPSTDPPTTVKTTIPTTLKFTTATSESITTDQMVTDPFVDDIGGQKPDVPLEPIVPIDKPPIVEVGFTDMTMTDDNLTTEDEGNITVTVPLDSNDTSTMAGMGTTPQYFNVTDEIDLDNMTDVLSTAEDSDSTTGEADNVTDIFYTTTTPDDLYLDDGNMTSVEMSTADLINVSREDDMGPTTDDFIDLDDTTDIVTDRTASYEDSSEINDMDSVIDEGSGDTTLESATSEMNMFTMSSTSSQPQTFSDPLLLSSSKPTLSSEDEGSGETVEFGQMTSATKTPEIQSTGILTTVKPFTEIPIKTTTLILPGVKPTGSESSESSGEVGSGEDSSEVTQISFTDWRSSMRPTSNIPGYTDDQFDTTLEEVNYLPVSSPQPLPIDPVDEATPETSSEEATPGTSSEEATPGTSSEEATPGTSSEEATPGTSSEETEGSGEALPTSDTSVTVGGIGSGFVDENKTTQAFFSTSSVPANITVAEMSTPSSTGIYVTRPPIDPNDFGIEESIFVPEKAGSTLPLVTFPNKNRWTPPKYVPPTRKPGTTESSNMESTTLSEDLESMATWLYDSLSTLSGFTGSPQFTTQEAGPPPPVILRTTTIKRGDIPPPPDITTVPTRRTLPPKPTRPPIKTTASSLTAPVQPIPLPTKGIKLPITDNSGKGTDTTVVIKPSLGFVSIRTTVYHNVKKAYNVGKKIADAAYKKAKGILRRTHRRLRDLWEMCKRGAIRMVYAPYNTARNIYSSVINRGRQGIANMVAYARSRVKKYYSYLKNYYKKSYNYYYTQYYNYFKNKWANYWG